MRFTQSNFCNVVICSLGYFDCALSLGTQLSLETGEVFQYMAEMYCGKVTSEDVEYASANWITLNSLPDESILANDPRTKCWLFESL